MPSGSGAGLSPRFDAAFLGFAVPAKRDGRRPGGPAAPHPATFATSLTFATSAETGTRRVVLVRTSYGKKAERWPGGGRGLVSGCPLAARSEPGSRRRSPLPATSPTLPTFATSRIGLHLIESVFARWPADWRRRPLRRRFRAWLRSLRPLRFLRRCPIWNIGDEASRSRNAPPASFAAERSVQKRPSAAARDASAIPA